MKNIIRKVLREQTELPTTDIYHVSIGFEMTKWYSKSDLFFKDYNKAVDYLTSKNFLKREYSYCPKMSECWFRDRDQDGNITSTKDQARITTQKLIV
tara:strand:- start:1264 stop:1554 length:291 start_codon:yes stop_codon:yes gene_type:complete